MSVSTYATKEQYNGNDITDIFPFTFRVLSSSDIVVVITDVNGIDIPQTENTEYMVTINEDLIGGNIIFDEDYIPSSGSVVSIYRIVELTQEAVYVENDPFHAKTHEDALDKLTMITQQLDEALGRSITIPITSSITDLKLSPKPNMLIGFNSDASALALYGTAASNHNDFAGLQGGKVAEYYHLTSNEYTSLKDMLGVDYLTVASTGVTSNTWTINSTRDNVTSVLAFGRTTGGDATISWDGSMLNINRNVSITDHNIRLISYIYGTVGQIWGSRTGIGSNTASIGFLDADAHWGYEVQTDTKHSWRINNIEKMLLTNTVLSTTTNNITINSSKADINVSLTFGRTTGGDGIISYNGSGFHINKPVGIGGIYPNYDLEIYSATIGRIGLGRNQSNARNFVIEKDTENPYGSSIYFTYTPTGGHGYLRFMASQDTEVARFVGADQSTLLAGNLTINSTKTDVTSSLIFGRTTGGDATITYSGSSLMLNRNVSITSTTSTVDITLASVYGTAGYVRGLKNTGVNANTYIGFVDSSGNWAYEIRKDPTLSSSSHTWSVDNTLKMVLNKDTLFVTGVSVLLGDLIITNIPGSSVTKQTVEGDWAFGYGACYELAPGTPLVEWGMCGTDFTPSYGYFGPAYNNNYLRVYPTYTQVYGNLLVQNNSFVINNSRASVTSTLTFGRTSGGDVTISYAGTSLLISKYISINSTVGTHITLTEPSYNSAGVWTYHNTMHIGHTSDEYSRIAINTETGQIGIGVRVFISNEKLRIGGDTYADGNVSALSFTDRTPFYEADALSEIMNIKGKDGEIDHSTLPPFVRKEIKKRKDVGEEIEQGRDIGAMVSMLTVAVQQLKTEINDLKKQRG